MKTNFTGNVKNGLKINFRYLYKTTLFSYCNITVNNNSTFKESPKTKVKWK